MMVDSALQYISTYVYITHSTITNNIMLAQNTLLYHTNGNSKTIPIIFHIDYLSLQKKGNIVTKFYDKKFCHNIVTIYLLDSD